MVLLVFKTVWLTHTLKEVDRAFQKLISQSTEGVVQWQNTCLQLNTSCIQSLAWVGKGEENKDSSVEECLSDM